MTYNNIGLLLGTAYTLSSIVACGAVLAQTCSFPDSSVKASTEENGVKYEMVKPCYKYQSSSITCEVLLTNTTSEEIQASFYQSQTVLIDDEGTGYKDSRLGLAGAELTFSTDGTLQPGIPTKLIVSFPNAAKSAKKLILLQLDRRYPEGRVSIRNPGYKAGK